MLINDKLITYMEIVITLKRLNKAVELFHVPSIKTKFIVFCACKNFILVHSNMLIYKLARLDLSSSFQSFGAVNWLHMQLCTKNNNKTIHSNIMLMYKPD